MSNMTITIPKNINKCLTYFLIIWVMLEDLFISQFSFPSFVRYLNDVIVLWLLITCLLNTRRVGARFRRAGYGGVLIAIAIYSLYLLLGIAANGVPVLQVLWAFRNTYRFFLFYIACILLLDKRDMQRMFSWLCQLQWVNLLLGIYQYRILGKKQDYLGGIFGTAKGCNALLNVYLCFIIAYVTLQYMQKRRSLFYLLLSLASSMILAGLSELKIVFIEIPLIILVIVILSPVRRRLFRVCLTAIIAIIVGLLVLKQLFPDHFAIVVNLEQLIAYGNSEEGSYTLSRFHAFENINKLFFHNDVFQNLFGFGFGNCEYSAYDFLTSSFYKSYGSFNYRWFAHQIMFLETGYIGIFLYLCIIGMIFLSAVRNRRRVGQEYSANSLTIIMCIITAISIWYNASVRTEAGYLLFFMMTADAIVIRQKKTVITDSIGIRRRIRIRWAVFY